MATKKPQDPNNSTTDEKPKRTRSKPKERAAPVELTAIEDAKPALAESPEEEPAEDAEEPAEEAEEESIKDAEPSGEAAVRAELMAMERRELGQMYRRAVRRKLKPSVGKGKAVEAILRQLARQG